MQKMQTRIKRTALIVKFITLDSWNFIGGAKDVKSPKLLSTPTHMEKKPKCMFMIS